MHKRHQTEMKNLKTTEESDRKEMELALKNKFEKEWADREEELRTKLCKERDLEIDRVIENLEMEMKKTRDEAEKNFDVRINRLCSKHSNEIEEMVKEIEQLKVKVFP